MSRGDCRAWIAAHGYPQPPKSSCIGCPFHNDAFWKAMKQDDPADFADAIEVDRALRKQGPASGDARTGIYAPVLSAA